MRQAAGAIFGRVGDMVHKGQSTYSHLMEILRKNVACLTRRLCTEKHPKRFSNLYPRKDRAVRPVR